MFTTKVILDQLHLQARNWHFRSREYQFLILKLLFFSFFHTFEKKVFQLEKFSNFATDGYLNYVKDHVKGQVLMITHDFKKFLFLNFDELNDELKVTFMDFL